MVWRVNTAHQPGELGYTESYLGAPRSHFALSFWARLIMIGASDWGAGWYTRFCRGIHHQPLAGNGKRYQSVTRCHLFDRQPPMMMESLHRFRQPRLKTAAAAHIHPIQSMLRHRTTTAPLHISHTLSSGGPLRRGKGHQNPHGRTDRKPFFGVQSDIRTTTLHRDSPHEDWYRPAG